MTTTEGKKRTRRTPDEIVRALLDKTIEKGATAGEERAAVAKAEELIAKHVLDRSRFEFRRIVRFPPRDRRGARSARPARGCSGRSRR